MEKEITQFEEPKEVTVEKLFENHAELMNEIIKETNATNEEIVRFVKFMILIMQNMGTSMKEIVEKAQQDVSLRFIR